MSECFTSAACACRPRALIAQPRQASAPRHFAKLDRMWCTSQLQSLLSLGPAGLQLRRNFVPVCLSHLVAVALSLSRDPWPWPWPCLSPRPARYPWLQNARFCSSSSSTVSTVCCSICLSGLAPGTASLSSWAPPLPQPPTTRPENTATPYRKYLA